MPAVLSTADPQEQKPVIYFSLNLQKIVSAVKIRKIICTYFFSRALGKRLNVVR
jgi:hypothetical protein